MAYVTPKSVEKPEEKMPLENLHVNGRIILKETLNTWSGRV
jgi:UTP-glucose-1-phosphate uridylyltransferase